LADVQSQIIEVCVFRRGEGATQYLLLQRASGEKLYPNIWQIVTGTINAGETAVEAALRELKEETDLTVRRFWTVPWVDSYYDSTKDVIQAVPVFAAEIDPGNSVRLSGEHQKHEWLSCDDAKDKLVWPGQRMVIDVVHEFISSHAEAATLLELKNVNFGGKSL